MLNTKEQIKSVEMGTIQQEPLFTELTPEAAAVVVGGKSFTQNIGDHFDDYAFTREFHVRSGTNITLRSKTSSERGNETFTARVTNVNTGHSTAIKLVPIDDKNESAIVWTNMRGGTYRIDLRDEFDGTLVRGKITVNYVP